MGTVPDFLYDQLGNKILSTFAEFIRMNADSIWLSQNEMWEEIVEPEEGPATSSEPNDIPF
jgi:hypothetical protein